MQANPSAAARSPAEIYDAEFVPALFGSFADIVAATAGIAPGEQVLDVACGTGVLACAAARRVGEHGVVTGLDANPEMLAVARRKPEPVEWVHARAEALPFAAASFDAVVSQFALMFFEDRAGALREMQRVLRRPGRLAVAVCGAVEDSPGYGALAALLDRLFGKPTSDAFRAPFALGDHDALRALARQAGLADARVTSRTATVRFPSVDALVAAEHACVWTLGGMLDDAQFERLRAAARPVLAPFVQPDGSVAFGMPAPLLTCDWP